MPLKINFRSSQLSTFLVIILALPIILNWSLLWLNLVLPNEYIFDPLVSGFTGQLIWSIVFFGSVVILSILTQQTSFSKKINLWLLPFLGLLICFGIFLSLVWIININLIIAISSLVLIGILLYLLPKYAETILTLFFLSVIISVNLAGSYYNEITILNTDSGLCQNLAYSQYHNYIKIYKKSNLFIFWEQIYSSSGQGIQLDNSSAIDCLNMNKGRV